MSTQLVGIINMTPDSFSDGGDSWEPDQVLNAVEELIREGAAVLDLGAESTRPGARSLSAEEEWERLASVLALAAKRCTHAGVALSVDTRHAATALRALEAGASWINDVGGFRDDAMVAAVMQSDCRLVMMHALSIPADPAEVLPPEADVVATIMDWGHANLLRLEEAGVAKERIIFDPGIGFGKTAAQSLSVLRRVGEFKRLGVPLLVGHSRKSYLSRFTDAPPKERDNLTVQTSLYLRSREVDYLRVHNIAWHRQAFALQDALCSNG